MGPLGHNKGGYFGERIDIEATLSASLRAAQLGGWDCESIPAGPGLALSALIRRGPPGSKLVYISAGIHGDEPAGPLAVRRLLEADRWPGSAGIYLCPCLNPTGFPLNRRENAAGEDLNRDYLHLRTPEVRAHLGWLARQPRFDLALCLHEDWEARGFYIYELNPDGKPSLAEAMIRRVEPVCPIDPSTTIEGRQAKGGIIRREAALMEMPKWPEAFYLAHHKTRLSYTLEAPSDYPMETRVAALVAGVEAALEGIA